MTSSGTQSPLAAEVEDGAASAAPHSYQGLGRLASGHPASQGASFSGAPDSAPNAAAVDPHSRWPLPVPLGRVLLETAKLIAERGAQPLNLARVADPEPTDMLLKVIGAVAGLRKVLAQRCGVARDRGGAVPASEMRGMNGPGLAACLLSEDAETATAAGDVVRRMLQEQRRQARRDLRASKRVDPEEKRARREQDRLGEARKARDRARAQAEHADQQVRALREQLEGVRDEAGILQSRLQAATDRAHNLDQQWRDPARLAAALADVLCAEPRPATTDETDGSSSAAQPAVADDDSETTTHAGHDGHGVLADPRAVGPGEPRHVLPGRARLTVHAHPERPSPAPMQTLAAAAEAAGLPAEWAHRTHEWLPTLLAAISSPPTPHLLIGTDRDPRVQVLGASDTIGGSCVLITAGSTRVLVDAGQRPGGTDAHTQAPPGIALAMAEPLDAIVVTHAHGDHAGWVPAVVAQQPHLPVFVTDATAALLQTMWTDAVGVMSRRAREQSALLAEQGELDATVLPSYTREDVQRAIARLQVVDLHHTRTVGDLTIELFEAGHIVGAAGVVVAAGPRRVVISGDVSKPGQMTVGGIVVPDSARGAELLLLESTYADKDKMTPRGLTVEEFVRDISRTLEGGGRVLVPAFALGRAQEIALIMREHLPEAEVLVEGLAADVSAVYERYTGPDGQPLQVFGGRVKRVPRGMTNAEITRLKSGVVIATSGMMTGGPALSWARQVLPTERDALMVVGYQDAQSPGGQLLRLAEQGGGVFDLPGRDGVLEQVEVNARVAQYQLGAHASAAELATIASEVRADEVMLVHGRADAQRRFEARLDRRGQRTVRATVPWAAPAVARAH